MNRNTLSIIFIALQILVLGSFVVRYEILKSTGTTVYVSLRGYDPTDIFRGDYVNLTYELPYEGTPTSYSYGEKQYLIPELEGKNVTKIQQITTTKPESGIYFQIQNGWMQNSTQKYTINSSSGSKIEIMSTFCQDTGKPGDEVLYLSGRSTEVQTIRILTKEDKENAISQGWNLGKLISKGECTGMYRFQTTATDRWFVPEGEGTDLEKKIREGNIYAEWKIGKNGAVIITGVVGKEELVR